MRSNLVPHAVLLTRPRTMKCTLVVSQHRQKAVCKSRLGHLWSSNWCFQIVHECIFLVQAKSGFHLMRGDGQFSQRWSHLTRQLFCVYGSLSYLHLTQITVIVYSIYIYIYICVCVCVCMYVCMYVCM